MVSFCSLVAFPFVSGRSGGSQGISRDARFRSVLGAVSGLKFPEVDAFLYQSPFIRYKFWHRFRKYGGKRDVR